MSNKAEPLPIEPMGCSIGDGAVFAGLSKSQFRRVFIDSGRIKTIKTGTRDRIVLVNELRAAFTKFVAERRDQSAA